MLVLSLFSYGQLPANKLKIKLNASKIETFKNGDDYIFKAKNTASQKWGLYEWNYFGVETTEIIPAIYDNIELEVESYFQNSYNYIVTIDNKKGLFVNEKIVLKTEYNELIKLKNTSEFIVRTGNKYGLVYPHELEMKIFEVLPIDYQSIEELPILESYDIVFYQLKKNEKFGLFSSSCTYDYECNENNNNIVLPIKYDKIKWDKTKIEESSSREVYIIPVNENEFVITDLLDSKHIIETSEYFFKDDIVVFKNDDSKYKMASFSNGFKVYDKIFDQIIPLYDDKFAVCIDNKWGLINDDFKTVIKIKYGALEFYKRR